MVARKSAIHCRSHAPKTKEHVEKIAVQLRGRKWSPEKREALRQTLRARSAAKGHHPVERICKECGAGFIADKMSSRRAFCSDPCRYKARTGERSAAWAIDMPITTCIVCGKVTRAATKAIPRVTCSYSCNSINRMRNQRNKATNIEIRMRNALRWTGAKVLEQHLMPGFGVPDFFLPTLNAVIFCDGDYWHGLPEHIVRDAKQTAALKAAGYEVYRFWGSAILKDVWQCLRAIRGVFPART